MVETAQIDWPRLVSLDFETYFDGEYTLKKMSTSEYIRDPRFKAQMVGIKIGNKKTKVVTGARIKSELAKINWATHSLLCHNTHFDGLILSHHFGIVPAYYYCSLSMARGLHSNEIGAGLDEVAKFYGGEGKVDGVLEKTRGELNWPKQLVNEVAIYCERDVEEMYRIFVAMQAQYPAKEMQLIHLTMRMFCAPVLRVDIPRVEAEYVREYDRRQKLLLSLLDPRKYDHILDGKDKKLEGEERDIRITKKVVGSTPRFVELFADMGIPAEKLPRKISPAWMKKSKEERQEFIDSKWAYAFAKDDLEFLAMPGNVWDYFPDLDPNYDGHVMLAAAHSTKLQQLIDTRIAVKSTTNITRAERFLKAGANGWRLPVGYAYYRASTGRFGGNNKMNMQNLMRGGELRLSILADKGHAIAVADSGQIEARVNAWLWDQDDLLESFRVADRWDKKTMGVARGANRDAYCRFGDGVYGREITTEDFIERFVGKVCVAQGEMVLTHQGLVAIENITTEHRLWDGVEWVTHSGLIDQGIQEVITYEGLTATPDHQVFTEDGRVVPLRQAASEMARLQTTGDQRRGVRFCDSAVIADTPRKRLSVRQGQMRPDWYYQADVAEQLKAQEDDFILEKRPPADSTCDGLGTTIRRDCVALHQPGEPVMVRLRGPGHSPEVQQPDGVHPLDERESAPQGLQGGGDRQDRQRWALRAEQLAPGHQDPADPQPAQHGESGVARNASAVGRIHQPILSHSDGAYGVQWDDRRADLGAGSDICGEQAQELALNRRKTRVYDIADAGPRRRFTVQSRIILNCVLGLGYQMGATKFQLTLAKGALGGPPVNFTLDECHRIVNLYRRDNFKIVQGWKQCASWIEHMADPDAEPAFYKCLEIGHGYIRLPNGMCLKYPDLRKAPGEKGWDEWSYQSGTTRKKIYGGLLCENLVQALARIIVMEQMLMIDTKYPVVMTTHDEVVAHPKVRQADKCYAFMHQCMTTSLWWCEDIPLAAEGGWALNYSK